VATDNLTAVTHRSRPESPVRRVRLGAVAAIAAIVPVVLLAAALPAGAATSPTIASVRERGGITVGTKFDQPLFGLTDPATGEPAGFDVEIAKLVVREVFGAKVARNVSFVETPSKARESALTTGAVDLVVATYTITPERDTVVDFAGPYYETGQSILVPHSDTTTDGVADLAGTRDCTVTGSTSATNLAAKAPTAVPVLLDTYSACVAALRAGEVDAVTTDEAILLGFLADDPSGLRLAGRPFTTERYGIGIPEGDRALERKIDAALTRSFRDGSWTRAWKRTIGPSGAPVPEPPTRALKRECACP